MACRQLRRHLAFACLPLVLITASPPLAQAQWRSPSGYRSAYGNGYRVGNGYGYRPRWANGYGYAVRPGYGWNPGWGWWGGSAAFWGISSLATSAILGGLINNSIRNQQQTIVVPNSTYQLAYGSVKPLDNSTIEFRFNYQGRNYQATADCRQGWLNGQQPTAPAEAELLNAACQMAFGSLNR